MKTTRKGSSNDLSVLLRTMLEAYRNMLSIVNSINQITENTKVLSINSSIEAAHAGNAGKGFSVIAKEIRALAEKSNAANNSSFATIDSMHNTINDIIGVRTADVAYEMIDKVDRNLFERFCDVQAWSTFNVVRKAITEHNPENEQKCFNLLSKLHQIYEVYHDIFVFDKKGNMVGAAVNKELVGKNFSDRGWFKEVVSNKTITISDMYFSKDVNNFCVGYHCPVFDLEGEFIGIVSTRFNWDYILDILDQSKLNKESSIYIVNSDGMVIASKDRNDVLAKDLSNTEAVHSLRKGEQYGYFIEEDDKGNLKAIIGYAHTRGYNSYKGKGWSVIVKESY